MVFSTEIFGLTGVRTRELAVLDFSTDQWTHSDPNVKGSVAMMPDGALYSMTGGQSNQTFMVSRDGGRDGSPAQSARTH